MSVSSSTAERPLFSAGKSRKLEIAATIAFFTLFIVLTSWFVSCLAPAGWGKFLIAGLSVLGVTEGFLHVRNSKAALVDSPTAWRRIGNAALYGFAACAIANGIVAIFG